MGGSGGSGGTGGKMDGGMKMDGGKMDGKPGDGGKLDGGNKMDGAKDSAGEAGGSADICQGYTMMAAITPAPAALDFCTKYGTICMFGAGAMKYTSMGDCMTKYMGASDMGGCRAAHLCNANANTGAMRTTHCDHSFGVGPCAGK
jgi:hypothetical protein